MTTRYRQTALCIPVLLLLVAAASPAEEFSHFITRKGDRLFEGDNEFRFISFNVPNLHLIEDNFPFADTSNWILPTSFEIRDAFQSVKDAGGLVIRQYCFRIHRSHEPPFLPKHITSWRTYYEPAFLVMDTILACANSYGIRLIIPFLEGPPWWGPKREFARLRGRCHRFESPEVIEDYRHFVGYLLNRRNTVTGRFYKEDRAVLCWETGNEMPTSTRFLHQAAAYIKRIDPNHLVMDGFYGVRRAALDDPGVDIVSNHFYRKGARGIRRDIRKTAGRKAYIAGEWGWSKQKAERIIRAIINSPAAGALVWSLRYRYRKGGFTWHKGQGMHWPGGFYRSEMEDEKEILATVRRGAFTIRGLETPPLPAPAPPVLLPIDHPSLISWQGSAGATAYTVERAPDSTGPWHIVGSTIDETVTAYRPLFSDTTIETDSSYFYRVTAHGPGGLSAPSAPEGPTAVGMHLFVDELVDTAVRYASVKGTSYTEKNAWRFKYDFHRRKGRKGDYLEYIMDGPVTGVRIFAFFPKKAEPFTIAVSADGKDYSPLEVHSESYPYCCANPRDRLRLPVLFTANAEKKGNRIRITFPKGRAQAGRCEIDYAK